MSYQGLMRIFPPQIMRELGTAGGEILILSILGAAIGLGIGIFLPRKGNFTISFSCTTGVFSTLFGILWCRTVLIHSDNRMISAEGLGMIMASFVFGVLVGSFLLLILGGLSRYRLDKAVIALILLGLFVKDFGFSLASPAAGNNIPPHIKHVVLLGGDGATWDVALPMIREGKLPHLEKLMERGSWGDIRTTLPWKSPILWASIATGKREKEHGIHDFVIRNKATHEVTPVSLASRKVKAIWDVATEAGLRVDVINWYGGWPAEALNGTMVSSRLMLSDLPDRVFPKERTTEIDQLVQRLGSSGIPQNEAMTAQVGLYLLERDQPDYYFLYLRDIDHRHHFFWRYYAARKKSLLGRWLYGSTSDEEIKEKGRKIEEAYEALDAVLGKILERVGPETAVVVVSDHGGGIKRPGRFYFNLNPLFEAWGLLRYESDGKKINWRETKLYDATKRPWYEEREIFVNRRPEGPFGQQQSAEGEQLLESVVGRLKTLNTVADKPLTTKVEIKKTREEDLHLIARVNVHLKEEETLQDPSLPISKIMWRTPLTGNHRANGILVMGGPGIKSGYRIRAASVLDITPTLLYLMNLPVGNDMQGRILREAIDPNLLRAKPARIIPTYETGKGRTPQAVSKSSADAELLDQLRSLGYIQ